VPLLLLLLVLLVVVVLQLLVALTDIICAEQHRGPTPLADEIGCCCCIVAAGCNLPTATLHEGHFGLQKQRSGNRILYVFICRIVFDKRTGSIASSYLIYQPSHAATCTSDSTSAVTSFEVHCNAKEGIIVQQ